MIRKVKISNDKLENILNAISSNESFVLTRKISAATIRQAERYIDEYYEAALDTLTLGEALDQLYFVEKWCKPTYCINEVLEIGHPYLKIYIKVKDIALSQCGDEYKLKFTCTTI